MNTDTAKQFVIMMGDTASVWPVGAWRVKTMPIEQHVPILPIVLGFVLFALFIFCIGFACGIIYSSNDLLKRINKIDSEDPERYIFD